MAKRVYRFVADLRPPRGPPPASTWERATVDAETRREAAWQERLARLSPASLEPGEWEDPLAAQECLMSYNASLKRAQALELGFRGGEGIDCHVFFDAQGGKNIVTQPIELRGRRLAHLLTCQDGTVFRYSLESPGDGEQDLSRYFQVGIAELDDEDLCRLPGFRLVTTRYAREGEELVAVDTWHRYYDVKHDAVILVG